MFIRLKAGFKLIIEWVNLNFMTLLQSNDTAWKKKDLGNLNLIPSEPHLILISKPYCKKWILLNPWFIFTFTDVIIFWYHKILNLAGLKKKLCNIYISWTLHGHWGSIFRYKILNDNANKLGFDILPQCLSDHD